MGEVFVGSGFGDTAGTIVAFGVSVVFGVLLLSAVNTAIVGLVSISYLMSRDAELPKQFEKLNPFGVPTLGLAIATIIPAILGVTVREIAGFASLYCVGDVW